MKNDLKLCKSFITKKTILNAIHDYKKIADIRIVDENDKYIYLNIRSENMEAESIKKEFTNYCIGTEGWNNES